MLGWVAIAALIVDMRVEEFMVLKFFVVAMVVGLLLLLVVISLVIMVLVWVVVSFLLSFRWVIVASVVVLMGVLFLGGVLCCRCMVARAVSFLVVMVVVIRLSWPRSTSTIMVLLVAFIFSSLVRVVWCCVGSSGSAVCIDVNYVVLGESGIRLGLGK